MERNPKHPGAHMTSQKEEHSLGYSSEALPHTLEQALLLREPGDLPQTNS